MCVQYIYLTAWVFSSDLRRVCLQSHVFCVRFLSNACELCAQYPCLIALSSSDSLLLKTSDFLVSIPTYYMRMVCSVPVFYTLRFLRFIKNLPLVSGVLDSKCFVELAALRRM